MFKNKRFLITQPALRSINGSTVVSLELANTLQQLGAKITIYTCDYAEPAKTLFTKNQIKVDLAENHPQYKLQDFDYIWVHSQILPLSLLQQLSRKLPTKLPSFIFLHMSGMDWIPDEKPWIYNLENQLSSLSLFICEEVKNVNVPFLNKSIPTAFFRNPVPAEYKNRTPKSSPSLKNLLIVSSHPPEEILKAKQILTQKHHINVTILGEGQEKYELFNKKLLEKYDALFTIAKTVPYCLVSGTPVYVYDAYGGGPGWLNSQNFESAKFRNFSGYQNSFYPNYEGDGFHFKTAEQIVSEIINGYNSSLVFHQTHQEEFQTEFIIDSVLPEIFAKLQPRKLKTFSSNHIATIIASELFAADKFKIGGLLYDRDQEIFSLRKELSQAKSQNKFLTSQIKDLITYKQTAETIFNSGAYKFFDKAIVPYKKIKDLKRKKS